MALRELFQSTHNPDLVPIMGLGRLVALCRYEPFGYTPQAFGHGPQSAIALPLASFYAHPCPPMCTRACSV
jgi:hypothetical protein